MTGQTAIFVGEFIGTAILLLMGNGVVAGVLLRKSKAFDGGWIVVTFGWGMAVLAGAYAILDLSGGHINPAVTIGLYVNDPASMQGISEVLMRILAQILGGIVGATLCWLSFYKHFQEAQEPTLGIFSTIPAIRSYVWNFVTEVIATFVLVIFIIGINLDSDGKPTAAIADSGIGVLLVAMLVVGIGLCLGGPTGYAINPARDLGPRIAHAILPIPNKGSSDWAYSWVPILGPIVGGTLAGLVGAAIFGA